MNGKYAGVYMNLFVRPLVKRPEKYRDSQPVNDGKLRFYCLDDAATFRPYTSLHTLYAYFRTPNEQHVEKKRYVIILLDVISITFQ